MAKLTINTILFFLAIFFAITQLAFDFNLGTIFFGLALFSAFFYLVSSQRLKIESSPNKIKSIIIGIVGWAGTIILSLIFLPLFKALGLLSIEDTSLTSIFNILASSQPLAFSGNQFMNFLSLGVAGPIVETVFLMVAFVFIADLAPGLRNFSLTSKSFSAIKQKLFSIIALILTVASIFVILHSQAKGIRNNSALLLVGIFAIVTSILFLAEGQGLAAIVMHIINNTIALAFKFSLVTTAGPIVIAVIGIGIVLYFVLKNIQITERGVFT